jgi:hypothetical protein
MLTFRRLKPVLLLPLTCLGDMAPPLARGFEGRPSVFRGGTGAAGSSFSGVGGGELNAESGRAPSPGLAMTLSTLALRGADVGGKDPPVRPRGPVPNSAKLLNFLIT